MTEMTITNTTIFVIITIFSVTNSDIHRNNKKILRKIFAFLPALCSAAFPSALSSSPLSSKIGIKSSFLRFVLCLFMFLFFPLSLPLLLLLSCPKRYKPSTHLEDEQQSRNPSGQRTPFIIELIV